MRHVTLIAVAGILLLPMLVPGTLGYVNPPAGWALVDNRLALSGGVCKGGSTVIYHLIDSDVAGELVSTTSSTCAMEVRYHTTLPGATLAMELGGGNGEAWTLHHASYLTSSPQHSEFSARVLDTFVAGCPYPTAEDHDAYSPAGAPQFHLTGAGGYQSALCNEPSYFWQEWSPLGQLSPSVTLETGGSPGAMPYCNKFSDYELTGWGCGWSPIRELWLDPDNFNYQLTVLPGTIATFPVHR